MSAVVWEDKARMLLGARAEPGEVPLPTSNGVGTTGRLVRELHGRTFDGVGWRPTEGGDRGFIGINAFFTGALAVGVVSGAYQAEVFRGAYMAIPRGELEAARSVGMSGWTMFRRIVAPQVLRFAIPGLGNVWQLTLKDSALISVTGLAELMRTSQVAAGSTRQYFLFYIVGGVLYLLLTSFSDRVFNSAERRANRSMPAAAMGQS